MQLGQTAVSSKILATTTAVYNKIKAYNNQTSIKISPMSRALKIDQKVLPDVPILSTILT